MATQRTREIKPAFFANEDLASLTAHERLLFIGLWTLCDRRGITEDRPARIRAGIFPYEPGIEILEMLFNLERIGVIKRYTSKDGETKLIWLPTFTKHQHIHPKEKASEFDAWDKSRENARTETEGPGISGASRVISPLPSLPSFPSKERIPALSRERVSRSESGALFDRFWSKYPRKENKKGAFKCWRKIAPDESLAEQILASLEAQKQTDQWKRGIIPHPSTWLNQERWTDEVQAPSVDPDQAAWDAPPSAYPCTNPDCLEIPDMRAHSTPECPHPRKDRSRHEEELANQAATAI